MTLIEYNKSVTVLRELNINYKLRSFLVKSVPHGTTVLLTILHQDFMLMDSYGEIRRGFRVPLR